MNKDNKQTNRDMFTCWKAKIENKRNEEHDSYRVQKEKTTETIKLTKILVN